MGIKLYSKENLDLDELIRQSPLGNGLKKDDLVFIIHSIITQGAIYDDDYLENLGKEDGFIPLNSKILQSKIRNYQHAIRYLIEHEIIRCDGKYLAGIVSMGYKLCEDYLGKRNVQVEITDFTLSQKIKHDDPFEKYNDKRKSFAYLKKWFNDKLIIDEEGAMNWIKDYEEQESEVIKISNLPAKIKGSKIRSIIEKCECYRLKVRNIIEGNFYHRADPTGHRYHTNITNISKNLRQFLSYDNKDLVSIDFKNSQPLMSLPLFKEEFWKSNHVPGKPTLFRIYRELYRDIKRDNSKYNSIIMLVSSPKNLACIDIQKKVFFRNVVEGKLYEELVNLFIKEGILSTKLTNAEKRNKVKKMVLTLLYSNKNAPYNKPSNSPYKIFKKNFPTIAKLFELVKDIHHSHLAIILQRIESLLVLGNICGRISKEKPSMVLYTLHDSIVTTVGNEDYVKRIMEEETQKMLGVIPKLSIEYWTKTKVSA